MSTDVFPTCGQCRYFATFDVQVPNSDPPVYRGHCHVMPPHIAVMAPGTVSSSNRPTTADTDRGCRFWSPKIGEDQEPTIEAHVMGENRGGYVWAR